MKSLIRLARQKKGLSIKDMCELTHTSPNTFVNYENFSILQPKPNTLKKICKYLELNYEDVIRQFIERS